jgi:aspartate/methionine/tyrosine aminotransferase
MSDFFARRTSWDLTTNRYTQALEAHRDAGREVLDLTASNPTVIGLQYREEELLRALADPKALRYEPQPKGLLAAREAVANYYAARGGHESSNNFSIGSQVSADDLQPGRQFSPDELILTTSTSEAYSFVFRLLCDPDDALLVPTPSYPLFDFLADIQDVKLVPYELVYDHGWQIDFISLCNAADRAQAAGARCRAVLVVHPNNPTGSYVKPHEVEELNRICAESGLAIIADEVFLDYSLLQSRPLTFSANQDILTFTLSGLSKVSALPQMKIAWIVVSGPAALKRDALARLEMIADTYLSMNAPVQLAVPTMLNERHSIQRQLMQRIRANLQELDSQLASQKLCHRLQVEGGWYAVLRVPVTGSDEELAIALLQQKDVLVQPGHFYDFSGDGHLVLSLITGSDVFGDGVRRMLNQLGEP